MIRFFFEEVPYLLFPPPMTPILILLLPCLLLGGRGEFFFKERNGKAVWLFMHSYLAYEESLYHSSS